jgi:hypothetical protein
MHAVFEYPILSFCLAVILNGDVEPISTLVIPALEPHPTVFREQELMKQLEASVVEKTSEIPVVTSI